MDSQTLMDEVKIILTDFYSNKISKDEIDKVIKFRVSQVPTAIRVRIYLYPKIDTKHRLLKTKFIVKNLQHITELENYLKSLYTFLHPWEQDN